MSAALSLPIATESPARLAGGNMDRLTTMHPSADDWRFRAAWWRQQARLNEHLEQFERAAVIHANCDAMLAEADRLEGACAIQAPLSDAALVKPTATVLTLVPKRKTKPTPKVDARQFWALHSAAVSKIAAAHGLAWACDRPEETVNVTLPARLRNYRSDRGTLITFRRDWRMPAPAWWPEGRLPDGVEAAPVAERYTGPMGDGHPSMRAIFAAIAEARAIRRAEEEWMKPHAPYMLDGRSANDEAANMHRSGAYSEEECDAMMRDEFARYEAAEP